MRALDQSDADLAGDIIARSFADDPVNLWVFNAEPLMRIYFSRVARDLYLKKGFGHVSIDAAGATLWLPPGTTKSVSAAHRFSVAMSMLRRGGISSLKNGLAVDACLAKHAPKEPYYYLFAIGTVPEMQGKGIGGRLMQAGLERADAARMPAYLESSKYENVPFYRRYGFELMEKIEPAPGAPCLWPMWRPAAQ